MITSIPFLQDKGEYFLSFCAPLMKAIKYRQNEYIYEIGSPLDEIYFVVSGKFGLVLPDFNDFVYINILPGDYFGDLDFVVEDHDQKRTYCVKALSKNCEVYALNRQDILLLSEEFPDIFENFFIDAGERLKVAKKYKYKAEYYALQMLTKDNKFLNNVNF